MQDVLNICPTYHVGHILFENLQKHPHSVYQIDAATGVQITKSQAFSKSIKLAKCLRKFGMEPGDVLAYGGRNHVDIYIPHNAAILNGYPVVGIDPYYGYNEIKTVLEKALPKFAFCDRDKYKDYVRAAQDLDLQMKIVCFDEGESSLASFLEEFDDGNSVEDFKVAEFDVDSIYLFLSSTSGTTGRVKLAAFKHKPFITKFFDEFGGKSEHRNENIFLNLSPVNWLSSFYSLMAISHHSYCNLTTSNLDDCDETIQIINKYRPERTLLSPLKLANILEKKNKVDLTCFKLIGIVGSICRQETMMELRSCLNKQAIAVNIYGITEAIGQVLKSSLVLGSCGTPHHLYETKLIDPKTNTEVKEAYATGEMWCKGYCMFSEYYNAPAETAEIFSSDGFFKTGDILYRDDNDNYFYVDRLSSLIKYRNTYITPSKIEDVILLSPLVKEVSVIGLRHEIHGQVPVACVVPHDGLDVTEDDIKKIVSNKLPEEEHPRAIILFDKLPLTSSCKIAKSKLIEIVENKYQENEDFKLKK